MTQERFGQEIREEKRDLSPIVHEEVQEYKAVVEEYCCEGFTRGVVKERVLVRKRSLEKLRKWS